MGIEYAENISISFIKKFSSIEEVIDECDEDLKKIPPNGYYTLEDFQLNYKKISQTHPENKNVRLIMVKIIEMKCERLLNELSSKDVVVVALDSKHPGVWHTSPTNPNIVPVTPPVSGGTNGTLVISLDDKLMLVVQNLANAVVNFLNRH